MANTKKSWKGVPTNNLISTTPLPFNIYAYASGPVTVATINESTKPTNVRRYTITNAINFARAFVAPTLAVGQTYTLSYKIRYNGANTTSPSFYADASKGFPEVNGGNTLTGITQTQTAIGNGWYYVRYTFTVSASPTNAAILAFGVFTGSDTTFINNTFDIYEEQFEVGALPSPYINGARSNTQSVIDITRNNTVTVNNLVGNADGSFSFNGTDSYISGGNNAIIQQADAFTAEGIVKISDLADSHEIFSKGSGLNSNGNFGWAVSYYSVANQLYFDTYTTTTRYALTANHTNSTNWFHLAVTFSSGTKIMYVNGVAVASNSSTPHTIGNLTYSLMISETSSWPALSGTVPVFRYYNRNLTTDEIKQNFEAMRGRYGI